MVMQKSGLDLALDMAARFFPGIPVHITREWAQEVIAKRALVLKCGAGDVTGESHDIFLHDGKVIRIKRDWMGNYMLFHGEWKPDPHWTGD